MTNELKRYYLQQMGIEPWVARHKAPSENNLIRTQTVFSRGNPQAKLMIIAEELGVDEDKQGLLFAAKAGSLLNQMIQSIGLSQKDIYITTVLKCSPPDNQDPTAEDIAQCMPCVMEQIALVAPTLLLVLGQFAGQIVVKKKSPLNQLRKTMHHYNSIPCLVSYHPDYLLRSPKDKKNAYRDLLQIKHYLLD